MSAVSPVPSPSFKPKKAKMSVAVSGELSLPAALLDFTQASAWGSTVGYQLESGALEVLQQEAVQRAAYEMERQKKQAVEKMQAPQGQKGELLEFLRCIAGGEQDKAEAMLKKRPNLALRKGSLQDLSGREFKEITGFQYALWALDWHMWRMLLKYLPKEAAAVQFADLEEKGTAHGKHFSLEPLIEALNGFARDYQEWVRMYPWKKLEKQWCDKVGGAQALLPACIVHEYCHPTRPFLPTPLFNEERLVRSLKLDGGSWFTIEHRGGRLGQTFGVVRSSLKLASVHALEMLDGGAVAKGDAEAVQNLWKVRQLQLKALELGLTVSSSLDNFLPPVLTEVVIDYLRSDSAAASTPGR